MDISKALTIAGEALAALTALLSFLGTVRNGLTHLGWLSTEGATKFGKVLDRAALICEKGKKGIVWVGSLPGFASQPKDAPAPDVGKVVPLLLVGLLAISGCAEYSACIKAQMGPTLKAVTAQQVEQQISAILTTAASAQWVALGLQTAEDACVDTNCKALVSCAAQAWAETHPAVKPAVQGVQQFKASKPASAQYKCGPQRQRLASL